MPEKLWKVAQRRICRMLGGESTGVTGKADPDCQHDWLAVEVKCNKKMPAYLQEWMAQTWWNADPDKLPILVWHNVGEPYGNALVILKLKDFQAWFDGEAVGLGPVQEYVLTEEGRSALAGIRMNEAAALGGGERVPFDEPLEEFVCQRCQEHGRPSTWVLQTDHSGWCLALCTKCANSLRADAAFVSDEATLTIRPEEWEE